MGRVLAVSPSLRASGPVLRAYAVCLLAAVTVAGRCQTATRPTVASVPAVTARSAIVVDAVDGRILWSRDPDRRMYPASLTKMATCAVALEENPDTSRMVTIGKEVAAVPETGLYLEAGERIRLSTLIQATLVHSANDAAAGVAQATSGSVDAFVDLMNRRVQEWGARNTHYANPHGLHDKDHWSTARDQAIVAFHAMRIPAFAETVATRDVTIRRPVRVPAPRAQNAQGDTPVISARVSSANHTYHTRNRLLDTWEPADGIKTGYTRHAGRCLAASATIGGWRAICVVLNSSNIWADSRALLQWAFDNYELRPVVAAGKGDWQARVHDGQSRTVRCAAGDDVGLVLAKGAPAPELRAILGEPTAPVTADQRLGVLEVVADGKVRRRVELLATENVDLSLWGKIKRESIPGPVTQLLLCLAAGVLLLGTAAKAARTRRGRVQKSQRADHPVGQSEH